MAHATTRSAWLLLFGLAAPACGTAAAPLTPPGLEVGARLADIRMFELDGQSRVTLVDGTVLAVRWPWVHIGSAAQGRARYWVNFDHVCSFRLER